MNYSDIVYAHIAEAIKKHGERYGISQVSEFKLERFVVEPPVFNKSTVDTFKSLVEPGGSEDFERGSKEFDTGMKTPFGKALEHLLEQRYPDREVVAVGADRESDRIIEGAEHISLELQFYVEEKG